MNIISSPGHALRAADEAPQDKIYPWSDLRRALSERRPLTYSVPVVEIETQPSASVPALPPFQLDLSLGEIGTRRVNIDYSSLLAECFFRKSVVASVELSRRRPVAVTPPDWIHMVDIASSSPSCLLAQMRHEAALARYEREAMEAIVSRGTFASNLSLPPVPCSPRALESLAEASGLLDEIPRRFDGLEPLNLWALDAVIQVIDPWLYPSGRPEGRTICLLPDCFVEDDGVRNALVLDIDPDGKRSFRLRSMISRVGLLEGVRVVSLCVEKRHLIYEDEPLASREE